MDARWALSDARFVAPAAALPTITGFDGSPSVRVVTAPSLPTATMPRHDEPSRQSRYLTALPVYNEASHVAGVLDEVLRFAPDVLVVDDGSTDGTSEVLSGRSDVRVVRHSVNRGYGAALATAFAETLAGDWAGLVTIDCDGQHQPRLIPAFISTASDPSQHVDIVSGSRYLEPPPAGSAVPADRRRINEDVTAELNRRTRHRHTGDKHAARHHLGVAHDPAAEPGHKPIGRVVVGVVDSGLKLSAAWRAGQPREQLEDFRLLTSASR